MVHLKNIAAIFSIVLLLPSCESKESEPSPADNSKDRKLILTHWVDQIVIPSYENFKHSFDVMKAKSDAFTAVPDQTSLSELREAWVNAYLEWQKVDLFEFGPADKYTLRNFFNIYPTDVSGIVANMNDPASNLDVPASYPRQGFPALDYLINGVAADDISILASFTTDPDAEKRLAYLERITGRMNSLLNTVVAEWKGPFADDFVNQTGIDIGSSFGLVINAFVLHYERYIRSGKIGIPSGAAIGSSGIPSPERVEAYYKKDISLALAKNAHQAAQDFFNGKAFNSEEEGPSFKSYLNALGAKDVTTVAGLSQIIDSQFEIIEGELNELSPNLYEQIQADNQEMVDTYAAMQKLVRILKVDMTSAMSVTITYTDNDGD